MTKTYNTFEELHADYASRFGEGWDRSHLPETDHIAFVEACYDLYPKTMKLRDVYHSQHSDVSMHNGQPFEIIQPVSCANSSWDLEALPAYQIRFTDTGEEISAYPEELFEEQQPEGQAEQHICSLKDGELVFDPVLCKGGFFHKKPVDGGGYAYYLAMCSPRVTSNSVHAALACIRPEINLDLVKMVDMNGNELPLPQPFASRMTPELSKAVDTVCAACPYIVSDEYEAGEKYCDRCMVRKMVDLFEAEERTQGVLSIYAPEWQAIVNY